MSTETETYSEDQQLPTDKTFQHAGKIAILEDKPILLDYWTDSFTDKALIGVKQTEDQEKILIKNEEEYTSPIAKVYKVKTDFIIETENSLYLVDAEIDSKKIS